MVLEKAHAKLSASGSEIWLNCPGSIALAATAPPEPESKYAAEGTKAHELLEIWARHILKSPMAFTFPKWATPGMIEAVRICIDDWKKDFEGLKNIERSVEKKVSLEDVVAPGMFGTVDLGIAEHFGTLFVTDYKHGAGVKVEIEKESSLGFRTLNTQLVYYALGLAKEYDYNFKDVRLKIVQPRCGQGKPITSTLVPMKELKGYIPLFKKGVERTENKNARRFAGPWCRFCKAKKPRGDYKGCPEGMNQKLHDARNDFGEIED